MRAGVEVKIRNVVESTTHQGAGLLDGQILREGLELMYTTRAEEDSLSNMVAKESCTGRGSRRGEVD